MSRLNIVFMGTPDFAVPSLQAIIDSKHQLAAVFTQPDRPRGRGHRVSFSPVKQVAKTAGVPIYQPRTLRDGASVDVLHTLRPDVIVVIAYGQILPKEVLQTPPLGCINVHASLLPRHRGAAPIQAALAAGDEVTGITTMFMDEGLDTGDMIFKREIPIWDDDNAGTLHDRLAQLGAEVLMETLTALAAGNAPREKQDDGDATYAPKLTRADAQICWEEPAIKVCNHVRAFAPRPGAYTVHRGHTIKITEASLWDGALSELAQSEPAGRIIANKQNGFVVRAGEGAVLVTKVQPAGRASMSGRDYSNGFRLQIGESLG